LRGWRWIRREKREERREKKEERREKKEEFAFTLILDFFF
jgi:hypothetical protein